MNSMARAAKFATPPEIPAGEFLAFNPQCSYFVPMADFALDPTVFLSSDAPQCARGTAGRSYDRKRFPNGFRTHFERIKPQKSAIQTDITDFAISLTSRAGRFGRRNGSFAWIAGGLFLRLVALDVRAGSCGRLMSSMDDRPDPTNMTAAKPSDAPPAYLGVAASALGRRWVERAYDASAALAIAQRLKTGEIVGRLLAARGVGLEGAQAYLNPSLKSDLPDPSVVLDMDKAAERLAQAVTRGEPIAVFGDYDVDGATSTALMVRFLRAVGADPIIYIPDRLSEGYGPNVAAMTKLARDGAKIIITVDCGTQAHAALEAAAEAGADVIVCDHHLPGEQLPRAFALVNPNRRDDISGLTQVAAVGVAFLMCVAANRALREAGWFATRDAPDLRRWLSLVALGTVADVVPLTGLNRAFVIKGLEAARGGHVGGMSALMEVAALKGEIEPYHLGFVLGPRVNAGGRVGRCDLGARLLSTDDAGEALSIARELDALNQQRRMIEQATVDDAIALVESDAALRAMPVLVVAREGWHPGVIGIVAGRLKERYAKPAVVIAINDGVGKGSARSVNGADLGSAIVAAREVGILSNGGGHAMAAGLTIDPARIAALGVFLSEALAKDCAASNEGRELVFDGAVSAAGATAELCALVAKCGPYGAGNAEPLFVLPSLRIVNASIVGENHVRCVMTGRDGARVSGIAFRAVQTALGPVLLQSKGRPVHIAASLKAEEWQGQVRVQAMIKDAASAV
jgi:single-stranded-DNA-specific exonuclease